MSEENKSFSNCECNEMAMGKDQNSMANLPGLSTLQFRAGTHGSLKKSMLKALSKSEVLEKLTSRNDDDMAIASTDAWATVLDVINFYQERIINEGYIRTATERLSILELAKQISYKLRPGVAAGTFLAFSMNDAPGAPEKAFIPKGTKVQSIPEQGQLPHIYETTEDLEARLEWNGIKLQTKKRVIPEFGDTEIYLKGINTGLKPGDGILIIGDERKEKPGNENWDFRKVKEVLPDPAEEHTRITWDKGLGDALPGHKIEPAKKNVKVYALRQRANLFGYNAPDFRILTDKVKGEFLPEGLQGAYYNGKSFDLKIFTKTDEVINFNWGTTSPDKRINIDNFSVRWTGLILSPVTGNIKFITTSDDGVKLWINNQLIIDNWTDHRPHRDTGEIWLEEGKLYSLRLDYYERSGSSIISLSWSAAEIKEEIIPGKYFFNHDHYNDWPDFNISGISGEQDSIHLDAIYPAILKGSWLVIATSEYEEVYEVAKVAESSRKNFTLTSKTSIVKLLGENLKKEFDTHVRDAVVFAQSEEVEIAEKPIKDSIKDFIELKLEKIMPHLSEGKVISVSGKRKRIKMNELEPGKYCEFIVHNNKTANRKLSPNDSLIILGQPGSENGKTLWNLIDSGGNLGFIIVDDDDYSIIAPYDTDDIVREINIIKTVNQDADPTAIILQGELQNYFDPKTVTINANIAKANHGETKQEVLGSGNGSLSFQKFKLKQTPLTYTSASQSTGSETSLRIRVNDILWTEVPSFYGRSGNEKIYTTSIDNDGIVTIMFGDGIIGARLPSGTENIRATYRVGSGTSGLLNEGQLSMLLTPQLGVSKVINPEATSGAADQETRESARQNAPLTVLTLDRIVSVKDYEDFTRSFSGIGKARADVVWDGEKQVVFITIALDEGRKLDKKSDLYKNLQSAIKNSGHSSLTFYIEEFESQFFTLHANIAINNGYDFEMVKKNIIHTLLKTFSFKARSFGQDVTPGEVIAVIQSVEGVKYTDLESLNEESPFSNRHFRLSAMPARILRINKKDELKPAELITINKNEITITQILK